ncbi:hypothetical protein C453_19240 [Haloferax elongans ATCC BAA-1513]|uniref:DUF7979 domain-containing protein n=1 Tax=Haloferax elongans ATCC BAA-1513 TaxID=1230453 RepID=M0HAV1_HALEO|nr:hypothetical protein [Haloferax elongans]ELZ80244.1 hypothetical protein C453_19240 [Haloferax elongans ATCC BAA-1513]
MSHEGQVLFETLLAQGTIERPADTVPSTLEDAEYVQFEGSIYALTVKFIDQMLAEYTLRTTPVSASEVDDDTERVDFDALSTDAKAAFKDALTDGQHTVRGETLPPQLVGHRYVRYEGTTHHLEIALFEIPIRKLSVEKVST